MVTNKSEDRCLRNDGCELCSIEAKSTTAEGANGSHPAENSLYSSPRKRQLKRKLKLLSEKNPEEFRQVLGCLFKQLHEQETRCICIDEFFELMEVAGTSMSAEDIQSMAAALDCEDCEQNGKVDSQHLGKHMLRLMDLESVLGDLEGVNGELEGVKDDIAAAPPSGIQTDQTEDVTHLTPSQEDDITSSVHDETENMLAPLDSQDPPVAEEDSAWCIRLPGLDPLYVTYPDVFQLMNPIGYR
eukprot:gnl/TRDRNA2_/TRDRNA2_48242_c0_seq1.p1 gnl/TRDRNA2_/TRDRNA2_48242_c0~~gnl/TRDRNA2_/TRDRNA2_48242_c0_seq1.p1  ORF type:complete len:243 (-),score=47.69 gnl/TRDRNA2_/TRDRNA2_48242_c0_seq1:38-766(-)